MLDGMRIAVVGAGRSGRAAAALASRLGAEVLLLDRREDAEAVEGARCIFGEHPAGELASRDLVVLSPGIPPGAAPVQEALAAGIDLVGEAGFAAAMLAPETRLVGVTGTDGKSTVTAFTGQLLEAAGWRVFTGGNLGTPLSEAVGRSWDAVVAELSSYQLEHPGSLAVDVAAVLNLAPDHLGRHGTMEAYGRTKLHLLDALRPGGVGCLPASDTFLKGLARGFEGRLSWLGDLPGVVLEDGWAVMEDGRVDLSALAVRGGLARWNAAVACLLAHLAGVGIDRLVPGVLSALPHRMEPVHRSGGILWIDDSKATNVHAAAAGLSGLAGPLVVLLGGRGKAGADYRRLAPVLAGRARLVLCFGEAGPAIAADLEHRLPVSLVPGLADAVRRAGREARPGDTVVLSPACASFDAYRDFGERGEHFRRLAGAAPEDAP